MKVQFQEIEDGEKRMVEAIDKRMGRHDMVISLIHKHHHRTDFSSDAKKLAIMNAVREILKSSPVMSNKQLDTIISLLSI